MSDKTKKLVGWALVSVAIIVAAFLGVNFPAPPPPVDLGVAATRGGVGQPIKFDRAVRFAQPVGMSQSLDVTGNTTVGGGLTVALTPVALQLGVLAGKRIVCGSTTITGTGTLTHGLATPSAVTLGLGQDATGNGNYLSFTNATGVVTAKAWNSALTPAPATTPVVVDWCINGTQ